jgi:hypothetical protein
MNSTEHSSNERLKALLREARPDATVGHDFQGRVWSRIERLEREETVSPTDWLARLAAVILQPKLAAALAVAVVLVGASIGAAQGNEAARQAAQDRYLAAIAPSHVR